MKSPAAWVEQDAQSHWGCLRCDHHLETHAQGLCCINPTFASRSFHIKVVHARRDDGPCGDGNQFEYRYERRAVA